MRTITIILLILVFKSSVAQIDFVSEKNKNPLHPEIASQIEKIHPESDFQIRFWIDGSSLRLDKKTLVLMSLKDGRWYCESYKFDYNKNEGIQLKRINELKSDCDSTWNYFMKNNILILPDMDLLKSKFLSIKENGDVSKLVIADGKVYSFEFIKRDKYKRIEYHCPITYFETYSNIKELSNISNIVKLIYKKFEIKGEPC